MNLQGKRALVTGASSGIGKAVALRLAREGAKLVISGAPADQGDLEATLMELREIDDDARGMTTDVADAASVTRLVDGALDTLGSLDVLVSNAGTYWPEAFLDITEEHWDRVLAVNLKGMFLVGQKVARHMVEAGISGTIINTASTNGFLGDENSAHYNTSKAGVIQLTKSMAVDLAPFGIRVNCVCPGMIVTRLSGTMSDTPDLFESYARRIPLDRWGAVDEVAGLYAFLASDDASYMTGTCLVDDGGLTAGLRWRGWIG